MIANANERTPECRASKKLRLNPTIIDLIFWRSYFQMRARNRAQTLQIATKIGCAGYKRIGFDNETEANVNAMLQIATKMGLYIYDRKYELTNFRMSCYKLLQKFGLRIND